MNKAYLLLVACFAVLLYVTVTKAESAARDVGLPAQFMGRGAF